MNLSFIKTNEKKIYCQEYKNIYDNSVTVNPNMMTNKKYNKLSININVGVENYSNYAKHIRCKILYLNLNKSLNSDSKTKRSQYKKIIKKIINHNNAKYLMFELKLYKYFTIPYTKNKVIILNDCGEENENKLNK
jgi:hypothetical protein